MMRGGGVDIYLNLTGKTKRQVIPLKNVQLIRQLRLIIYKKFQIGRASCRERVLRLVMM